MAKHKAREIIEEILWKKEKARYVIYIYDRITNQARAISKEQLLGLDGSFMKIKTSKGIVEIPLHRIIRIEKEGLVIYEKKYK